MARSSLRYQPKPANDDALRLAMIRLAKQYGWYGYRKVTALLRMEGWQVNHKKVERLWGEEGLQLGVGFSRFRFTGVVCKRVWNPAFTR
ncbi:IS3 family transposase [Roseovarius aestuarii]|uniref:IS3 family transposase n=1 Tax=Roseovarius aestuarii TaxID=475083 RepID=UPI001CBDDC70